ncbi:hypothetical protein [Variovorax paradoxus]|uniref:AraC-like ligand-binding domain-containing protein n=1 Tax=Variovorax paradoxus TaxID=34073 RepID=UPI0024807CF3|nr:hypothetical protein [Variovorax paradoxus]WGT65309.1 hypothetical protein QHG62_08185 [Variovorax paradoxus]
MQRFDTEHLPPEDRFAYWADEFGKSIGYVGLESPFRSDFHQWLSVVDLSALSLARLRGSAVSSSAEPGQIKDVELHPFQLMLKVGDGPSTIRQGSEATVQSGDLVLIDSLQKMRMQAHVAVNSLLVGLPMKAQPPRRACEMTGFRHFATRARYAGRLAPALLFRSNIHRNELP